VFRHIFGKAVRAEQSGQESEVQADFLIRTFRDANRLSGSYFAAVCESRRDKSAAIF
jgi:hypothetical protein